MRSSIMLVGLVALCFSFLTPSDSEARRLRIFKGKGKQCDSCQPKKADTPAPKPDIKPAPKAGPKITPKTKKTAGEVSMPDADGFRPLTKQEYEKYKGFGTFESPPPPLDVMIGYTYQWHVNDRGEYLYKRLGPNQIRLEFRATQIVAPK